MSAPPVIAVIPARYASTRLPGKPLLDRTGKPMIRHVVEAVRRARRATDAVVATDDPRIRDAVIGFGGRAVMTSPDHPNGTARIAEALNHLRPAPPDDAVIVNVQGDEPEVEPRLIDELVDALLADPAAPMATLASPFADDEDPADPNLVKIVTTAAEPRRALYFSRRLIPFVRSEPPGAAPEPAPPPTPAPEASANAPAGAAAAPSPLKHPGLYAYRRAFLPVYAALPPTPLERAERLEQLRALEHGHPIAVRVTEVRHHGIDTPAQYDAWVQRQRS